MPEVTKVETFLIDSFTQRSDGVLEIIASDGRGFQLGTKEMLKKQLKEPILDLRPSEMIRLGLRLIKKTDANFGSLLTMKNKLIRVTTKVEVINGP